MPALKQMMPCIEASSFFYKKTLSSIRAEKYFLKPFFFS